MKLVFIIEPGQRFIAPDKEFMALNREKQVDILRVLKQNIEDLILKNDLITARKAGYN